ncbi:hypothetical protein [Palleronia pelagia]|nr:hypothetical protein [Palleronia pelagia]
MQKVQWTTALAVVGGLSLVGSAAEAECAQQLTDDAPVSEIIQCMRDQEAELDSINRAETLGPLPIGAVISFDRTDGCPEGWTDMGSIWRGRTVVAAVEDSNDDFTFRRTGGSSSVSLEISNMPAHNHGGATGTENVNKSGSGIWFDGSVASNYYVNRGSPQLGLDNSAKHTHSIQMQGNGIPFEIMPRFVALFLCKKVSE